jgi:hypothetical protein
MKFFDVGMLDEGQAEDIENYQLPDDPSVTVRIRSVSMARMKSYQKMAAKGGEIERRAMADLIADSLVNTSNKTYIDADTIFKKANGQRTRRMMGIIKLITHHNGGDDEVKLAEEADEQAKAVEKKSVPTE